MATTDLETHQRNLALVYRISDTGPQLLKDVLDSLGWVPYNELDAPYWNLQWKGSRFKKSDYESCQLYQRLNHFPNTAILTKKDSLFRLLKTMKCIYGSAYDFFPLSFCVPTEYKKFLRHFQNTEDNQKKDVWICKPTDLSRGRGIFVFRELHELSYDCSAMVQKYIPNPLLISGYKFDMRCYVLVRSYDPLIVYLYQDGLARFATEPFDLTSLRNVFSHLTNTSINKLSPTLNADKEDVGPGCKWNFEKLKDHLQSRDIDFENIWNRIKGLVLLTLLPVSQEIPKMPRGCFELYGFDILIDDEQKPWILEVNLSPALTADTDVDLEVKKPLLRDTMFLLDVSAEDGVHACNDYKRSKMPIPKRSRQRTSTPPSTPPKLQPLWSPSKCGGFHKIFPHNDIQSKQNPLPKVGEPGMKSLIQEIKKRFFVPK
ncbi:tubulin-tyrosine ligase family-domain-containing protein [Globomyces pollinis-pini]|nr:tubulin-tyrosine ligase family-domain-containing protein [Globomyces pollinis-pini]